MKIVIILLAAGAFVFAGYSILNTGNTSDKITNTIVNNLGNKPSENFAPDFTLPLREGGEVTLSDYRGEKAVVLDFWASWCHNCQRDMPNLSRFYEKYSDQIEVIGVNLKEKPKAVDKFINSNNIKFPIAFDSGKVSNQYGVRYTNTHVLIDKEGKVLRVIPGDISEADIKELLEA